MNCVSCGISYFDVNDGVVLIVSVVWCLMSLLVVLVIVCSVCCMLEKYVVLLCVSVRLCGRCLNSFRLSMFLRWCICCVMVFCVMLILLVVVWKLRCCVDILNV